MGVAADAEIETVQVLSPLGRLVSVNVIDKGAGDLLTVQRACTGLEWKERVPFER